MAAETELKKEFLNICETFIEILESISYSIAHGDPESLDHKIHHLRADLEQQREELLKEEGEQ